MGWCHTHMGWFKMETVRPQMFPTKEQGTQAPHTRLPSPEYLCPEQESPQLLAVKNSGDSGYPSGKEGFGKSGPPFKGLVQTLTLSLVEEGDFGGIGDKGEKIEWCNFRATLEGKSPFFLCGCHISCVEPTLIGQT